MYFSINPISFRVVPFNNGLVAFESMHYMTRKIKVNIGDVSLKINFSKVYDRLDWGYIHSTMQSMGFDAKVL